jgi:cellobiose-specific phosphotransferase system component IIA
VNGGNDHEQSTAPKKNGLLTLLLSSGGDVSVKLITLALVVISGGSNLFATKSLSDQERHDRDRAIREIHELHDEFETAFKRQKQTTDMIEDLKSDLERRLNK